MREDASLFMLMHVAKAWGVQPSAMLDWTREETMYAMAYEHRMAELSRPREE